MNWIELPNNELLNFLKDIWYLKYTKLIGKLVKRGDLMFFTDIRSHEFRKIEYPDNQYNREINILFTPENNSVLNLDIYYEFYFGIRDVEKRILKNRLSIFYVLKKNVIEIKPKAFIETRNKVYTGINVELADTIRKAIKTLTSDINREPETFIYELLQNADDYPLEKNSVEIKFTITSNYLLLSHNGQPFNFQNVYALTGISQGDKRENKETIGFKGVGFKSIFKDSKFAIIKSGGFEFKFDESCFPRDAKRPWQIIPIWVENYDSELLNEQDFINGNVAIAIKPIEGDEKLRTIEKSYKNILSKVFRDDRILIFLRRIEKVIIKDSLDIEYHIEINKNKEKWFISNGLKNVVVQDSIRQWINKKIEDEEITIPEKFKDIGETKITFAVERSGDILTGTNDSKIYTYLPTEIDFGFKFLINGDFIPDGSRTELHDNEWNNYLAKLTGVKFVEWLYILGNNTWVDFKGNKKQFDRNYIDLIPDFNDPKALASGKNQFFLDSFKEGFESAIIGSEAIKFIPIKSGDLEFLSNILIDETGLAELLGDEFSQLTGISEKLIDSNVGEGVEKIKDLIKQNDVGVIYDKDRLKDDIQTKLQDWLKKPSNNFKFIQYINSSDVLKGLLKSEEIILSESLLLQKASALYFEVPKEITFLAVDKVNSEVFKLLINNNIVLPFKEFLPAQFFSENILEDYESLNTNLNSESNLLNFWQFVFNNWSELEQFKECLKRIYVLCKQVVGDDFTKSLISETYLSSEFNLSTEIESVVKEIRPDAKFISEKHISKKNDASKWREIFIKHGAIGDLQSVITDLLPKLPSINEDQHFVITKQIFKYWKDNKEKETKFNKDQIDLIMNNLKLKCIDNIYRATLDCIISDHFQTSKIINTILEVVILSNQISSDYSNTQISEWNTFFKEIGCVSLEEKQKVLDAKLLFIVHYQDELQESHLEHIKGVNTLYNARNTNGLDFDFVNTLSKIKLKTGDNKFNSSFNLHLSSIYKPKIDLEIDSDIGPQVEFLSREYYENRIPTKFLLKIGVNDNIKFLPVIDRIHIDKFTNKDYLQIFLSMKTYLARYDVIVRNYTHQQIHNVTTIRNHFNLNYSFVFTSPKYLPNFWEFVLNNDSLLKKMAVNTELRIWDNNIYPNDNYVLHQIKVNETVLSNGFYKIPSDLYSRKLMKYLDLNEYPDLDFSLVYVDEEKLTTLEELIGIRQELSIKHIRSLMSNDSIFLTEQEIKDLNIVEILKKSNLELGEIEQLKFPNTLFHWKPINDLLISNDENIKIDPSQKLHVDFICLAEKFGIQELSERNLMLSTKPDKPPISYEIKEFIEKKAKYIAFIIDRTIWEEIESNIIEQFASFRFYEVEFVAKIFPEVDPIYENILDFHYDEEKKEVYFKGLWKTNKNVLDFLYHQIQSEKIETVWFDNIINRWDKNKIIETLIDIVGDVPDDWVLDNEEVEKESQNDDDNNDPFWSSLNDSDIEFIREIIGGEYELNEQMDSNLAAKIKTLMSIRNDYSQSEIVNEEYSLKAGPDEIVVRSAQRGLLFFDLYHWRRLGEKNVKLAIHTNNKIIIFNTQQDLFDFAKPMNKYGIMKLPVKYSLEDLNSIGKTTENGKWHFVFIVNEKTQAAKKYIDVMNLDDYNF